MLAEIAVTRVGSLTSWVRPKVEHISRKDEHWDEDRVTDGKSTAQSMPGKLKSPSKNIGAFGYSTTIWLRQSNSSLQNVDVLSGGR